MKCSADQTLSASEITFYPFGRTTPTLSEPEPKCREHAICQKYGAVFIIGIGCKLSDGKKHDGRAPDYDDYTSTGLNNLPGLNGDLLLWDDVLHAPSSCPLWVFV